MEQTKIIECFDCEGEGTDKLNHTCKSCNGMGSFIQT